MGIFNKSINRALLSARPELRVAIRAMISSISNEAFDNSTLDQIEQQLIGSIEVSEAMQMPAAAPPPGGKLWLTSTQLDVVKHVISRFSDEDLRRRVQLELNKAITSGRIGVNKLETK